MKNIPKRLILLAVIATIGLIFSILLTQQFYEIRNGAGGFKSICNISQTLNCDAVTASPYAELVGGLPLSSFGAGWFLAILLISFLAMIEEFRREASRGLLALFAIGSGVSLIYFFVMAAVIKSYCLYCLTIDGLNFVGLGIAFSLENWKKSPEKIDFSKWKWMAGLVAGSLFVSIVLSKNMDGLRLDSSTLNQVVDSFMETPPVAVNSGNEFPSIGPDHAPITIVEFSDFQCPYCRIGASIINSVINRYPTQVRVVFRNFPLDPNCNPEVQRAMHPYACQLARLATCAHRQGKFKEVYENFFENQANLAAQGPNSPLELAKAAHANSDQLSSCSATSDISSAITRDIEEAKRLGISSTPTFFVNGKKIEGIRPPPIWNKIIDRILATSQTAQKS